MKTQARNVVLAVEYRLWGILRQNGWWNHYANVQLTPDTELDEITRQNLPPNTYVFAENRHAFVFINQYNEIWPSGVTVYDSGHAMSPSGYTVDYVNATITLNAAPSGVVTADLDIFECNVRLGYPKEHELELLDLPVLAYQPETDDGEGWSVGTSQQLNRRHFNIYGMAKNPGQQMDLLSDVRKFIRFVPFVDYSDHEPLDENKALDLQFSYADQLVSRMFVLNAVRGTYLEPRPGGSDKEQYRTLIAFELEQVG